MGAGGSTQAVNLTAFSQFFLTLPLYTYSWYCDVCTSARKAHTVSTNILSTNLEVNLTKLKENQLYQSLKYTEARGVGPCWPQLTNYWFLQSSNLKHLTPVRLEEDFDYEKFKFLAWSLLPHSASKPVLLQTKTFDSSAPPPLNCFKPGLISHCPRLSQWNWSKQDKHKLCQSKCTNDKIHKNEMMANFIQSESFM